MQRVKRSTAVAVMPAPPVGGVPGFFTGGDPQGGVPATVPGYEWHNWVQEELIAPIEGAGVALAEADTSQLMLALATFRRNPLLNGKPVFSINASALTCAVKHLNGNDPSASKPVYVLLRSAVANSADHVVRKITGPLSLTISAGSSLGHQSGVKGWAFWNFIDNAGAVELAVAGRFFGYSGIVSTTAEGGAGAADSANVMYSAIARNNVAFACFAATEDTQVVAGTWDAEPSFLHSAPFDYLPGQQVGEEVVAESTVDDATTSNVLQNSSLAATLTPRFADSDIEVSVVVPQAQCQNIGAVNESTRFVLCQLRNETDAVDVGGEYWFGRTLASPSATAAPSIGALFLRDRYRVNSVTTRTFRLRFATPSGVGVNEARLLGSLAPLTMTLREIRR